MQPIATYKTGDTVVLEWVDSASDERVWAYGDYRPAIMHIKSCGLVFANDEKILTITTCYDEKNNGAMAPMNIPWACVTKIREVA